MSKAKDPGWRKIILHRIKTKTPFSDEEARAAAFSWHSCACWNIPKSAEVLTPGGGPKDEVLWELGGNFGKAVMEGQRKIALRIHDKIQRRIKKLYGKGKR